MTSTETDTDTDTAELHSAVRELGRRFEPTREFVQRLSSTPRGARLARRLTEHRLDVWGIPYGSPLACDTALVVGELAANAATHGRVPGRDFALRLAQGHAGLPDEGGAEGVSGARPLGRPAVLIEVTDTRPEIPPTRPPAELPAWEDESGRGLLLVDALSENWGVRTRPPGKTIWALLTTPVAPRGSIDNQQAPTAAGRAGARMIRPPLRNTKT